jgi:response regulator RpfG family c-di-GMP phosphodiesterase
VLAWMRSEAGGNFDPALVGHFVEIIHEIKKIREKYAD